MKYLGKITNDKDLVTKEYVEKNFCGQVTSFPAGSAELAGKIYQYIGETTSEYTKGCFYEYSTATSEYWEVKWSLFLGEQYTSYCATQPPESSPYIALYSDTALTQPTGYYADRNYVYDSSEIAIVQGTVNSMTGKKPGWQPIKVQTISTEWGSITGTLSDQTDLQSALDGKQDTIQAGLAGRLVTYSGIQGILSSAQVQNNLTSTSTTDVLSAKQGKVLNETKQDKIAAGTAGNLVAYSGTEGTVGNVAVQDNLTSDSSTDVLSAKQGKALNTIIGALSDLTTSVKTSIVLAINSLVTKFEDYLPLSGGKMTGKISTNGNGGIYWKEDGYGDQFQISPSFSGSGDSNYLAIKSAVGGSGETPAMTDKVKVLGDSGAVVLANSLTVGGNIVMGSNKITGLATPTDGTDAVTKNYVDSNTTWVSVPVTLDSDWSGSVICYKYGKIGIIMFDNLVKPSSATGWVWFASGAFNPISAWCSGTIVSKSSLKPALVSVVGTNLVDVGLIVAGEQYNGSVVFAAN